MQARLRIGKLTCTMALIAATLAAAAAARASQQAPHPLGALSASEIEAATSIVRSAGYLPEGAHLASLTVLEPTKEQVLDRARVNPLPRRALATLRAERRGYELVVTWIPERSRIQGVRPGRFPSAAPIRARGAAGSSRSPLALAMRSRGLRDHDTIHCIALSPGYFGEPGAERRLVKLPCFKSTGATANLYDRPIEGVVATVDLDAASVLEVLDSGTAPVSSRIYDFKGQQPDPPSNRQGSEAQAALPARTFRQGSTVQWGPGRSTCARTRELGRSCH